MAKSRAVLSVLVVLSVALRLAAALYMGNSVLELPGTQDQISYDTLAYRLATGHGFSFPRPWYPFTPANTPTAHWSFLYTSILAVVYLVFGHMPLAARLGQAIAGGILIPVLIYRIGAKTAGRNIGLIAAGLSSLYAYFIYYAAALMTETLYISAVLLSVDLTLSIRHSNGQAEEVRSRTYYLQWGLLGFTFGLAILLRQVVLPFAVTVLAWLVWSSRGIVRSSIAVLNSRRRAIFGAGTAVLIIVLMVLPWTWRNYRVFHQFLLLNSNAGYALYSSTHPALNCRWIREWVSPIPSEMAGWSEAQIDRTLTSRALGNIISNPWCTVELTLSKVSDHFLFWPLAQSSMLSNVSRLVSFGLLWPFMLLGVVLSLKRWRDYSVLYLFVVLNTAVHLMSWPSLRYRLASDAVLLVFAGIALDAIWQRFRCTSLFERHMKRAVGQ